MRSKSASSRVRPASRAIAMRCSTALVEPPVEATDAIARDPRDVGLLRVGRRDAAAAERGDAEELADDRHRVRGELTAAGAGAGTRLVFDRAELGVAHRAGGVRADRLEHFLNRDRLVVELPRRNRAAVEQ